MRVSWLLSLLLVALLALSVRASEIEGDEYAELELSAGPPQLAHDAYQVTPDAYHKANPSTASAFPTPPVDPSIARPVPPNPNFPPTNLAGPTAPGAAQPPSEPFAVQSSPSATDPAGQVPAGAVPAGGEDNSKIGLCEVCMYVMENKMQHQPYLCKGLKDPHYQNVCVQVMESLMWWVSNQVYWVNYGCQMNQNGAISWVRPCPAKAICSWIQHLYLREPFCSPDINFPKPA